jgi:hypothetical protein
MFDPEFIEGHGAAPTSAKQPAHNLWNFFPVDSVTVYGYDVIIKSGFLGRQFLVILMRECGALNGVSIPSQPPGNRG